MFPYTVLSPGDDINIELFGDNLSSDAILNAGLYCNHIDQGGVS